MRENTGGGSEKFLCFLVGAGIGAVLALLFAPKSGRETREMIARGAGDSKQFLNSKLSDGRSFVEEKGRKLTDDFSSFVDKSQEAMARQKEQLTAAFDAGKAAYREEKGISE